MLYTLNNGIFQAENGADHDDGDESEDMSKKRSTPPSSRLVRFFDSIFKLKNRLMEKPEVYEVLFKVSSWIDS
jgi:hypothetical protein